MHNVGPVCYYNGMDQRTKNRIREHSQTGHHLCEIQPAGQNLSMFNSKTGARTGMFECVCGWQGWLDKE